MDRPNRFPRALRPYYMAGAGVGAALGWLLSFPGSRNLGAVLGSGLGVVLGGMVGARATKNQDDYRGRMSFSGHAVYSIAILISLGGVALAAKIWTSSPSRWPDALKGVLFFGTGVVVLSVLWKSDSARRKQNERRRDVILAMCGLLFTALSITIAFEDIVPGLFAATFFGWCTIALVRKH